MRWAGWWTSPQAWLLAGPQELCASSLPTQLLGWTCSCGFGTEMLWWHLASGGVWC